MKHLKAKLMATVMSLLLATLMLTSASFAWFTISTAPEVANIKTSVAANGNLEIALDAGSGAEPAASTDDDAGKNETWGNLVDLNAYFSTAAIVLKPVDAAWASGVPTFKNPTFGLDGRIVSTAALNRVQATDATSGNFADLGGVWAYSDTAATSTGAPVWAFEVDYWLRTNVEGNISLSEAANRGDGADGETGLGSWVSNPKITVKIVDGTTVYKAVPAATATDGKYTLSLMTDAAEPAAATIALTANTAKLLKMYVYFDGANITNADLANAIADFTMNVQFKHSETLVPMDVTQTNYGRTTPTTGGGGGTT